MPNRCGIIHVRGPLPPNRVSHGEVSEWQRGFEARLAPLLAGPGSVPEEDAQRLGRKDPEQELEKFVSANTQELGKDKWLCPLSGKKFKGHWGHLGVIGDTLRSLGTPWGHAQGHWGHLGDTLGTLGTPWEQPGVTGDTLRDIGDTLGTARGHWGHPQGHWGHLGDTLGSLGTSWNHWGHPGDSQGSLGTPWRHLGDIGDTLGDILRSLRTPSGTLGTP
uniref:SERRATE/Ars2 C-terminal domain-containing protein n=1 Tax=Catharus ustulatus TaxID=91951 RepID=A0A8C3UUM7_CATUS